MASVWYSGKVVVGSVGNVLVSSVTRLPVLSRQLVMEGIRSCYGAAGKLANLGWK